MIGDCEQSGSPPANLAIGTDASPAFSADDTQDAGAERRPQPAPGNMPLQAPRVAGYEIVSLLGAGGMGTVWRARQYGTRRDVALKLLNDRSMDGRARARFVREVELASRLQHPDIARVYDTGIHEGSYYYAMELLDGLPLDRYVREKRLSQPGILALVRDVCAAVQHAHVKGVIHRDLKPSNILVTHDGRAHVLDFGLAKPITADGGFEVSDGMTAAKGTLAYMSPEQAAGLADQVDTRCDVYSLGKVLFQLLTGEPAHPVGGSDYEMLRRVAEQEVRRPRDLNRSIHPDVEAILLKALDRDPRRRYATAGEMGRDIDGFLRGEPVSARPTTVIYFMGKKLARHRLAVTAVLACVLLLVALAVISYVRVSLARDAAEAARVKAAREAARADAVDEFWQYVLDALDPKNSHGRGVNKEMMDRADRTLSTRFANEPQEEASIRATLGRNMLALGQFASAEAQLRRAVDLMTSGPGAPAQPQPQALAAMQQLAEVCRERGKIADACALSQRVLALCKARNGAGAPDTLKAMDTVACALNDVGLVDEAENQCREALAAAHVTQPRDIDPAHPDPLSLSLAKTLVRVLRDSDDPDKLIEAESWARRVASARAQLAKPADPASADDPETLEAIRDLAAVLSARGSQEEAIKLFRRIVTAGPGSLGPEHPDLVIWQSELAVALIRRAQPGDAREAEGICHTILPQAIDVRGGEHLYSVVLLMNLAAALRSQGDTGAAQLVFREVESFATQALNRLQRDAGSANSQSLRFLDALVVARSGLKDWNSAEQACRQALELRRTVFGTDRREVLLNASNLGRVLNRAGKKDEARQLLTQTLQACKAKLRPGDPLTATVQNTLEELAGAKGN